MSSVKHSVLIVMGSRSDLPQMEPCMEMLTTFGIPFEVRILSAHRTPAAVLEVSAGAVDKGVAVIIAALAAPLIWLASWPVPRPCR